MNTIDLECIINCDNILQTVITGVYAKDEIPLQISKLPFGFVANMDTRDKIRTHWIAFHVDVDRTGYFFDSFGHLPAYYDKHFEKLFKLNKLKLIYNNKRLQSFNSNVCGFYCCFVLLHLCRNVSFDKIMNIFNLNYHTNDKFVYNFIVHSFSNCFHDDGGGQKCCIYNQ